MPGGGRGVADDDHGRLGHDLVDLLGEQQGSGAGVVVVEDDDVGGALDDGGAEAGGVFFEAHVAADAERDAAGGAQAQFFAEEQDAGRKRAQ
jgi:hypothetical protein